MFRAVKVYFSDYVIDTYLRQPLFSKEKDIFWLVLDVAYSP